MTGRAIPLRPTAVIMSVLLLAVLQAGQWGMPPVPAVVLGAALTLPLLTARPAPLTSTLVTVTAAGWCTFSGYGQGRLGWPWPAAGCFALLVLLGLLTAHRGRRAGVAVLAVTAAGVLAPAGWTVPLSPGLLLLAGAAAAGAVWAGEIVRGRRLAQQRLRAESAHLAVLDEQARIARELHDVVGHHLSMIAIEAQAAPLRSAGLPPDAVRSFRVVHGLARDGLTEMRAALRALRDQSPQPGLAELPGLLDATRRTGVTAELVMRGPVEQVPAGVQLAAYRIVQEALSNTARHAPGADTRIDVRVEDALLKVRVADTGPRGPRPPARSGSGLGLIGMRERASALGAEMRAGPDGQGGFVVETELPARYQDAERNR
ncbi:sensor histidine kinase [Actinoplanes sp. L3-i22]|uniref:sensor histidine kinase n=1 Tax=Actinoplanes sp. L3-i22 TaxID=2836373 RepID=UPI001C854A58|nr:sensor histidine kinase [Actinoplanes sp. L3-i22]